MSPVPPITTIFMLFSLFGSSGFVWVKKGAERTRTRAGSGLQRGRADAKTWHDCAMRLPRPRRRLSDSYRFPGFRPLPTVVGIFGEPGARVVTLVRRP